MPFFSMVSSQFSTRGLGWSVSSMALILQTWNFCGFVVICVYSWHVPQMWPHTGEGTIGLRGDDLPEPI